MELGEGLEDGASEHPCFYRKQEANVSFWWGWDLGRLVCRGEQENRSLLSRFGVRVLEQ